MAARRLRRLTEGHFGDRLAAIEVADRLEDAELLLGSLPDLILLDLDLAGKDGFSLMRAASLPPVIVVSARVERALLAFEKGPIDFVPKPVSQDRLAAAFERFDRLPRDPATEALTLRDGAILRRIALCDIIRLSGADDYVEVVLISGRKLLVTARLAMIAEELPDGFERVHRSHVLNLAHITDLVPRRGAALARSRGGLETPVSRSVAARIRHRLCPS